MTRPNIRILTTAMAIGVIVSFASALPADGSQIRWYDYAEGTSLGKEQGKKVLLYFWADWCESCEKMKKETLPESVLVSVDGDMAKARGTINILDAAIDYYVQAYISRIQESQKSPIDVFEKQMGLITKEVGKEADLSYRLKTRLDIFKKHVDLFKKKRKNISKEKVLEDLIPTAGR